MNLIDKLKELDEQVLSAPWTYQINQISEDEYDLIILDSDKNEVIRQRVLCDDKESFDNFNLICTQRNLLPKLIEALGIAIKELNHISTHETDCHCALDASSSLYEIYRLINIEGES